MSRNLGGRSLIFWSAFSNGRKLQLSPVHSKMNTKMYKHILEGALLPNLDRNGEITFKFQQDELPVHSANELTKQWLLSKNIFLLTDLLSVWLNPMENIWSKLARKVYQNNMQYQTVNELQTAILQGWTEIDECIRKSLINSMANRIF